MTLLSPPGEPARSPAFSLPRAGRRRAAQASSVVCVILALFCMPPVSRADQQPAGADDDAPSYQLAPGDTIDVKFDYVPELNDSLKVRPDGYISLQRIGEVRARGLTPLELTEILRSRYATVVKRPELTVIVRDYVVQQAFVGGEVGLPGVLPLRGQMGVLQAILASGGPRSSARLTDVLLIRDLGDNQAEARTLDLQEVVAGRAPDTLLQPFDVIFVPRTKIAKVGLFVEQYINALVPQAIFFPYNLDTLILDQVR